MAASRCDFHAPFRTFLSQNVGKVHIVGRHGPLLLLPEGGAIAFRVPDQEVRGVFLFFQDPKDIVQRPDAEHQRFVEIHRFQG